MKGHALFVLTIILLLCVESPLHGATPAGVPADASSSKPGSGTVPTSPNRAVLGLQCRDIQPADLGGNGITTMQGALVVELITGGPAASAGIQIGDVVVVVGGLTVNTCTDLVRNMRKFEPGEEVRLTVLQHGYPRDIAVRPMAQGGSVNTANNTSASTANATSLSMPATSLQMYHGGGFTISIPVNWTASVSPRGFTTYLSAPDGRKELGKDGMTILLGVIVSFKPAGSSDLQALAAQEAQEFKSINPGLRIVDRRSTALAGSPAEFMVLEDPSANEGRGERSWLVITLFNDQAFFITATSPSADFNYLQNLFGQILSSIRFTNY